MRLTICSFLYLTFQFFYHVDNSFKSFCIHLSDNIIIFWKYFPAFPTSKALFDFERYFLWNNWTLTSHWTRVSGKNNLFGRCQLFSFYLEQTGEAALEQTGEAALEQIGEAFLEHAGEAFLESECFSLAALKLACLRNSLLKLL